MSASQLYTDGGARPTNPGHAGCAAWLILPTGQEKTVQRYLGWHTNNYAEYVGLVLGIKLAIEHGRDISSHLDIFVDSQIVWGHMTQGWRQNIAALKPLCRDAQDLLHEHFEDDETGERRWTLTHVRREKNKYADDLCTRVILAHMQAHPSPFSVKAGVR